MRRGGSFAQCAILAIGALLAVALGSGCVAELDPSGAIRCGEAQQCPQGFSCRWGRCCPAGSTESCPYGLVSTEPTDAGAADPVILCDSDGACPPDSACQAGRCCRSDDPACLQGRIGMPCTGDAMCRNEQFPFARCDTDYFPAGYCVTFCNAANPTSCGALAECIPFLWDAGLCLARCQLPAPGRAGTCRVRPDGTSDYRCIPASDFEARMANDIGLCLPDCVSTGSACPDGTVCDMTTRTCARR